MNETTLLVEDGHIDRSKWPTVLGELADVFEDHFKKRGCTAERAQTEAAAATQALAHHLGGRPIYLPRGDRLVQELRNREIYRLFTGANGEELANAYRLSVRAVQRIVKQQMERQRQLRKVEA